MGARRLALQLEWSFQLQRSQIHPDNPNYRADLPVGTSRARSGESTRAPKNFSYSPKEPAIRGDWRSTRTASSLHQLV